MTSLAEKWMFIYPLVIAWSSHHRPRAEDETAFFSGNGVPVPRCFHLLQEPQLQNLTWNLQMNPSARLEHHGALWSPILPTHSHPCSFSGDEKSPLGHEQNYWTGCKLLPLGNFSPGFFFPRVSCMVFIFVKGILSASMGKRKQWKGSNQPYVL